MAGKGSSKPLYFRYIFEIDRWKSGGGRMDWLLLAQNPEGLRFGNRLATIADLKFLVDSDRVLAHRAGRNKQLRADLFVGLSLGQ